MKLYRRVNYKVFNVTDVNVFTHLCVRACACSFNDISFIPQTSFDAHLFPVEEPIIQLVVVGQQEDDDATDALTSPQHIGIISPVGPLTSGLATLLCDDDTLDTTDADLICLCLFILLL